MSKVKAVSHITLKRDPKGIDRIVLEYALGTSETVAPTTGWTTAQLSRPEGKYLWRRERTYYTDGTSSVGSAVNITGDKGDKGDPGKQGDGTEMIFILSGGKPARPEGDNPSGWFTEPQDLAPVIRTGDFALEDGKYHSGVTPDSGAKIDILTISGQKVGDTLTIHAGACCENNYDFLMVGQLDVAASRLIKANREDSNYVALALTGINGSNGYNVGSITFTFQDTAPHTVVIKYFKDSSNGYGEDKGYYTFSTTIVKLQWVSVRVTTNGVKGEWSDPVPFGNRGSRGASPRGPRDFESGVLYMAGNEGEEFYDIVYYDGLYYRCTRTHISMDDETPVDEIGHGYDTWELFHSYSLVATKVAFIGDGTQGWVLDNGVLRHSSGSILLTADGSIDAGNGQFKVDKDGNLVAKMGTFHGILSGVNGSFRRLTCVDDGGNVYGSITFGTAGQITVDCDWYSQGVKDGRSLRYYASDIWCRGVFGHYGRTFMRVYGAYGYFYPRGSTGTSVYKSLASATGSNNITYYTIPVYGGSEDGDAAGFPVDVVVITPSSTSRMYYTLGAAHVGKTVIVINANDDKNNVGLYVNGSAVDINGGHAVMLCYLGPSLLTPGTSSLVGGGWMVVGKFDNDW